MKWFLSLFFPSKEVPVSTPATAPSTATRSQPWTKRWYVTCSYCSLEEQTIGYYTEPKGWTRARYTTGGIACPACAPKMLEAEAVANEHNKKAEAATREAYAPAYLTQQAWDKANPRPKLPLPFSNIASTHETFIRRIACPGCGKVEVREKPMGMIPNRPAEWRYAGRTRGHGTIVCPSCYEGLSKHHAALDEWGKKRSEVVGDSFRKAHEGIIKSVSPVYPESK